MLQKHRRGKLDFVRKEKKAIKEHSDIFKYIEKCSPKNKIVHLIIYP